MLEPRIYRAGLVAVALGVLVLAFSLQGQPGPLGTTLAPDAFNGQNAFASMKSLAAQYPNRRPGSEQDQALAASIAQTLRKYKFAVSTDVFSGRSVDGTRTLQTVGAARVGLSAGSIVIVSHRDSLGSPGIAELSGTATLLELARVISGETLHRTVELVSTSGSDGAAGTAQLARRLTGSVDAVLVLGDLAGGHVRQPIVVPWSSTQQLAPPILRNTVSAALGAQTGLRAGGSSLASQLAHLSFPLTISPQAPFAARGEPAVFLSLSGERGPAPDAPVSEAQITAMGRTVLQTVSALDGGPAISVPSSYLIYDGKLIPAWAVRLLVLALILPVLGATLDGFARARRRGYAITEGLIWVAAATVPFLLGLALVLVAKLTGLIGAAPPGAVGAGVVPLRAEGIAVLIVIALVVLASLAWLRPFVIGLLRLVPGATRSPEQATGPGAAVAVLIVMCGISLVIWVSNPFAAALIVPALHLWIWVVAPGVRIRPVLMLVLVLAGLAAPLLLVLYYALAFGLDPVGIVWNGTLLVAGGQVGVIQALEWSAALGCTVSVIALALKAVGEDHPEQAPVTTRGPVSYAGPGSLGGTKSALRR